MAFDVAVFTNLTRDHLDYHETFSAYFAAKKTLFDQLDARAAALFNADDPAGARMVADTPAARISYGLDEAADIRAEVVEDALNGLALRMEGVRVVFGLRGGLMPGMYWRHGACCGRWATAPLPRLRRWKRCSPPRGASSRCGLETARMSSSICAYRRRASGCA